MVDVNHCHHAYGIKVLLSQCHLNSSRLLMSQSHKVLASILAKEFVHYKEIFTCEHFNTIIISYILSDLQFLLRLFNGTETALKDVSEF